MATYDLAYIGPQIDELLASIKGLGLRLGGVLTPGATIETPLVDTFWFAPAGTYTYGESQTYTVNTGYLGIIQYMTGSEAWSTQQVLIGTDAAALAACQAAVAELSENLQDVEDEIGNMPTIPNIEGIDFAIGDEQGYCIVLFEDGHLRTKNFNSKNAVVNSLPYLSQTKKYTKQIDEDFVFENVGLIGNWVKRTLNGTPVVSSYSWGTELLFQVKRTASVSANFILDSITAPVIAYQVDDGEWSTTNVASTISIATGLNAYEHIIRIRVSSCTLNETMYTNGSGMVNFSGLTVDSNALVIPLDVNNRKILFIGDSITGGVGSSVWQGYAYLLADMLNAANIQSALAGGGLVHGSRTYLPTAAQVLREMIQGSNNAINEPDIIFIMLGTNDGSQTSAANFTTAYSNLLKYIRKRFGGCHIFACSPFDGTHQADTQAATQVIDNVTWIPTTELAGTYSTSDGTHPDVAGAKVCAEFCYNKIIETINLNYFN